MIVIPSPFPVSEIITALSPPPSAITHSDGEATADATTTGAPAGSAPCVSPGASVSPISDPSSPCSSPSACPSSCSTTVRRSILPPDKVQPQPAASPSMVIRPPAVMPSSSPRRSPIETVRLVKSASGLAAIQAAFAWATTGSSCSTVSGVAAAASAGTAPAALNGVPPSFVSVTVLVALASVASTWFGAAPLSGLDLTERDAARRACARPGHVPGRVAGRPSHGVCPTTSVERDCDVAERAGDADRVVAAAAGDRDARRRRRPGGSSRCRRP